MSGRTVEAYVAAVVSLARHHHRSPDRISDEELQSYLLHLREVRHLAPSSLNQQVSALRWFYELILGRPMDHLERLLPRIRQQTRRPRVFSRAELERLFTVGCPEIRSRAFLMTVYGAGLRLAISPRRLRALDPKARTVTFDYKDYADGARHKAMTLKVEEFARRFALHILPERLVKIRHYGLLANRGRQERVAQIRALLSKPGVPATPPDPTPVPAATAATHDTASPGVCPNCGARALVWVATMPRPKGRTLRPIDTS
jgi:hypothetical protein